AAPFKKRNTDTVTKTEFIYTISGDYNWFTPEEVEKIVSVCVEHGLVSWADENEEELSCNFNAGSIEIPTGFSPDFDEIDTSISSTDSGSSSPANSRDTQEDKETGNRNQNRNGNGNGNENQNQSTIDRVLSRLVSEGFERREAVAEINKEHQKLGNVGIEAAARCARTG
ncbi:MAG: DUF2240 family protein, partial [Halobacteria archaeon]|nr:DUF2240 family protein [Halobacteria archaeon]